MLRGLAAAARLAGAGRPRRCAACRSCRAGPGLVLDDADCAPEEEALLHLLNLCAERGQAVLLAGREAPARWPVALPDLRSRLRAMTAVAVRPPGDALLAALLRRHFRLRQLRVDQRGAGLAAGPPAARGRRRWPRRRRGWTARRWPPAAG